MNGEFVKALEEYQAEFELEISSEQIAKFAEFYELVQEKNEILHLTAPDTPENFAIRHILESIYATKFLPENTKFADIGTGAGLPAIPCLIFREDLQGFLIESKLKKADFLNSVIEKLNLQSRAEILNRQFEELEKPPVEFVLCRALDKFSKKLPKILKWSENSKLLLFAGGNLADELENLNRKFQKKLLPLSEQRFLYLVQ